MRLNHGRLYFGRRLCQRRACRRGASACGGHLLVITNSPVTIPRTHVTHSSHNISSAPHAHQDPFACRRPLIDVAGGGLHIYMYTSMYMSCACAPSLSAGHIGTRVLQHSCEGSLHSLCPVGSTPRANKFSRGRGERSVVPHGSSRGVDSTVHRQPCVLCVTTAPPPRSSRRCGPTRQPRATPRVLKRVYGT